MLRNAIKPLATRSVTYTLSATTDQLNASEALPILDAAAKLRRIPVAALLEPEAPHMAWLNQGSLFIVYPGARNLEMTPLIERQPTVQGSASLESVSLSLSDGP